MSQISEHWAVIKASLGVRRFLLAPLLGAIIGWADWMSLQATNVGLGHLVGVPSWIIGAYAVTLFVLWWVLGHAVELHRQIRGTRYKLSKLRGEGVKLRNSAKLVFRTQTDFDNWQVEVIDWNNRVIEEIRKINETDAEWFSILDVVPEPRLQMAMPVSRQEIASIHWLQSQEKLYREHDFRLKRLGDMIRNLWRDSGEVI